VLFGPVRAQTAGGRLRGLRLDTGLEPTNVVTARIALTREHRASYDAANKIR
jgi:hypothetical protein